LLEYQVDKIIFISHLVFFIGICPTDELCMT